GHFRVNGKRVDIPSYLVDAGDVVVHLARPLPDPAEQERALAKGFESVRALADYAAERGVLLALENGMGTYNQTLFRFMDAFAAEPVVFCYDSGHENVDRSGTRVIEKYGARLRIVHLHDNTGSDIHALPFEGDTDWPRLMGVLGALGYANAALLECCTRDSQFKEMAAFLAEAMKRAQRLIALAKG
ncbi:MAG TPA: TIM barrel protein, partial [Candidatus Brocadiia bacterium]|nr:TIM barrel protein [Candidatus Brocadiia bacterium]